MSRILTVFITLLLAVMSLAAGLYWYSISQPGQPEPAPEQADDPMGRMARLVDDGDISGARKALDALETGSGARRGRLAEEDFRGAEPRPPAPGIPEMDAPPVDVTVRRPLETATILDDLSRCQVLVDYTGQVDSGSVELNARIMEPPGATPLAHSEREELKAMALERVPDDFRTGSIMGQLVYTRVGCLRQ